MRNVILSSKKLEASLRESWEGLINGRGNQKGMGQEKGTVAFPIPSRRTVFVLAYGLVLILDEAMGFSHKGQVELVTRRGKVKKIPQDNRI